MHDRSERTLRRGRVIFEVVRDLRLTLVSGEASEVVSLPYPRAGYGGHELVVARDEACLALYLFSGPPIPDMPVATYLPQ